MVGAITIAIWYAMKVNAEKFPDAGMTISKE